MIPRASVPNGDPFGHGRKLEQVSTRAVEQVNGCAKMKIYSHLLSSAVIFAPQTRHNRFNRSTGDFVSMPAGRAPAGRKLSKSCHLLPSANRRTCSADRPSPRLSNASIRH
jgi:hypothetical protein